MERSEIKINTGKKTYVIAVLLLLVTNILMSTVLMGLTKRALREQVDRRMLDIANVAAAELNGDELEKLTAADEGTESYNRALETLRTFQENIDLEYIYGVREEADGSFTFTIDPAVDDPGEFGSPIVTTSALISAARGVAAVDKQAYKDEWGTFYSAYSPVFDSEGKVAGIVAVDFNSEWFDSVINTHRTTAIVIGFVNLICAVVMSVVVMSRNVKSLRVTREKMRLLESDTKKLDELIMRSSIKKLDYLPSSENAVLKTLAGGEKHKQAEDEDYDLNTNIEVIYKKLHTYLEYVASEVNTDSATGVMNKPAYRKRSAKLDKAIKEKTANFSVAFIDINGFKKVNTHYGYEEGDTLMFECARLLKNVFEQENVYHVMGDEFIVLIDNKTQDEMEQSFAEFDKELRKYNEGAEEKGKLSISRGCVTFDPEKHSDYRQTFIAAKEKCDEAKAHYYRTH